MQTNATCERHRAKERSTSRFHSEGLAVDIVDITSSPSIHNHIESMNY